MFDLSHLHPLTVHFPIALIVSGFLLEILSMICKKNSLIFSKTAFYLLILGTLGAVAAYLTGVIFTEELKGKAGEIEELHEQLALATMIVMLITSTLKIYFVARKMENTVVKWIIFGLYFIGFVLVGLTGLYGGTLVYNYIIGGL